MIQKRMNSHLNIFLFIVIFLIVILFCFWYFFIKNSSDIKGKDLVVSFSGSRTIEIKNILPMSNQLGKNIVGDEYELGTQGYLELMVENTSKKERKFDIYLTKESISDNEIKDNYIKVYLTDYDNNPVDGFDKNSVPNYKDFNYLSNKPSSKLLYSGKIKGNEKLSYKVRAWLSDSYAISKTSESFVFNVNVREK